MAGGKANKPRGKQVLGNPELPELPKEPLTGLTDVLKVLAGRVLSGAAIVAFIAIVFVLLAWLLDLKSFILKDNTTGLIVVLGVLLLMGFAMSIGVLVAFIPAVRDLIKRVRSAESKEHAAEKARKDEELLRKQAEDEAAVKSRRLEAVQSISTPESQVWSRLEIKLDLPEETLLDLRKRLEDIQAVAFTWLSETVPNLKKNTVRVNVMLPDNRRARYGEVCHLFIPKWLHVNMDDAPDREIRFALTQGLVGKVFTSSRAGGALHADGIWKRVFFGEEEPKEPGKPDFELTEWQKNLLDPGLRWVLALPLLYKDADEQARALGVLDIDGIGFDMNADSLRKFYFHVAEKVTVVAAELGALPKQRVSILLQEAKA